MPEMSWLLRFSYPPLSLPDSISDKSPPPVANQSAFVHSQPPRGKSPVTPFVRPSSRETHRTFFPDPDAGCAAGPAAAPSLSFHFSLTHQPLPTRSSRLTASKRSTSPHLTTSITASPSATKGSQRASVSPAPPSQHTCLPVCPIR
ncbi:uncharacterized protein BKA78DRAFT_118975 [Phyllosticta capitalensis]|uniref:uncharacterized protein n=1 Tax=Phyllosticta capitalensis TaxID=121624 RepID=UPI00312EBD37